MALQTYLLRLWPAQELLATRLIPSVVAHSASIHSCPLLYMGHGSHSSDNDAEVLHTEKKKHLSGKSTTTIKGTTGWSEPLSSDSEAAVKADKHHGEQTIEELQEHTVKTVKNLHDPSFEEAEPEAPKNVPERAHH